MTTLSSVFIVDFEHVSSHRKMFFLINAFICHGFSAKLKRKYRQIREVLRTVSNNYDEFFAKIVKSF